MTNGVLSTWDKLDVDTPKADEGNKIIVVDKFYPRPFTELLMQDTPFGGRGLGNHSFGLIPTRDCGEKTAKGLLSQSLGHL